MIVFGPVMAVAACDVVLSAQAEKLKQWKNQVGN